MAFPIIQTINVTDNGATISHVINMPSGIEFNKAYNNIYFIFKRK